MRELRFLINKQTIEQDPSCDFSGIVQGTANWLTASFLFSKDWDGFVKVAEFRVGMNNSNPTTPVPIVKGRCSIPSEITKGRTWSVRIVGKKDDTILTTKSIRVTQERR